MVGKEVIVVCNLKPVKLRGVESQGMILAAGDDGDDLLNPNNYCAKDYVKLDKENNYVIRFTRTFK